MKRALIHVIAVAVALGVVLDSQAQVVVYSQPTDDANGPYSDGVSGQYWSVRVADNFSLSDPTMRKITEITWWGCSEGVDYFELENFSDWVIRIYADDGGAPGELLYAETVAKEDTNAVQTGDTSITGAYEYEQHIELSSATTLYMDEPYWISIGAICIDPVADGWSWSRNFNQGDGVSAEDHFDGAGYAGRSGDVAFALWGETAGGCPRAGCEIGDLDDDCMIGLSDLGVLLDVYGLCEGDPGYLSAADFDGSGCIDLADLGVLLAAYGADCTY